MFSVSMTSYGTEKPDTFTPDPVFEGDYQNVPDAQLTNLKTVTPGATLKAPKRKRFVRFSKALAKSCALNSRWILWSNTLFFLGNVCYLTLDVMDILQVEKEEQMLIENDTRIGEDTEWFENDNTGVLLNFAAALLFLANPITDFMGSWAEDKAMEVHEEALTDDDDTLEDENNYHDADDFKVDDPLNEHKPNPKEEQEQINYDKIVAQIFFVGSLLYLYLAYLDWKNPDAYFYEPIDILASHLFVVDAAVAVIGWKVNRDLVRHSDKERYFFSYDPYLIDWSGWGDWSFFFGSLLDAAISYMESYPLKTQDLFALCSDLLWTMNSILYTIGYIYGQDVRRRFANKYYTSLTLLSEDDETLEKKRYHNFRVQINEHTSVVIP